MTGLRALAGRPIAERERRGAFWVAAAILACAAAVLLLLPSEEMALVPSPDSAAQPAGGAPRAARQLPATPLARPLAAARRFLDGYLRFIYGRGSARAIADAAPSLRNRLAGSRLRIPPAANSRHPRVVRLDGGRLAAGRVLVTATITDGGAAAYPISLTLARRDGRWIVVAEGAD